MAKKTKSIAKLVEEAAVLLQKLVRLKAMDENGYVSCVTCGTTRQWNDGMQGGHFISRKWLALKLEEENVHPQCSCCNGPLRGNPIQYTIFMIDTYGREKVEEMERLKHESRKFYRAEVKDITQDLKEQIKELHP